MGRNLVSNIAFGTIINLGFQQFRPLDSSLRFRHLDLFLLQLLLFLQSDISFALIYFIS